MINTNNIKIDKADISRRNMMIRAQKGVSMKSYNILEDSDISGQRYLIDECQETDIIRGHLGEAEDILIDNIEAFKKIWSELDQSLADSM